MATSVLLASSGCSLGGDDEAKPASGPTAEIAATVDRLERAVAKRDYETICNQLFTPRARKRAGGAECARQLGSAAEGVKRPRIAIEAIAVEGNRAVVSVRTTASGQASLKDKLQLRRQDGRWLVEALG
jgi:hypothetical protein